METNKFSRSIERYRDNRNSLQTQYSIIIALMVVMAAESPVQYKLRKVSQRRVTFPLTSQSLCFLLNQLQVILFYRSVLDAGRIIVVSWKEVRSDVIN